MMVQFPVQLGVKSGPELHSTGQNIFELKQLKWNPYLSLYYLLLCIYE